MNGPVRLIVTALAIGSARIAEGGDSVRYERNGFPSVQLDVDSAGRNVPGDAANEPTLAVDPLDPSRLVSVWRHFPDVADGHREAGFAISTDGGESWSFRGSVEPGEFRSDPVLAFGAPGRLHLLSLNEGLASCDLFESGDGGEHWSAPRSAAGGDKPWLAADGERLYLSWTPGFGCCGTRYFTRSLDGGATFDEPIEPSLPLDWGTIAVGPDGVVYLAGENIRAPDRFVLARSRDAADPSKPPTFECFEVDLGGRLVAWSEPNPAGLLGQAWLAVDRSAGERRGTLYLLASVDPPGADPLDVHFARSTDGGETFDAPLRIHEEPGGGVQWFGTLSIAPGGRLDAVFVAGLDAENPRIGELRHTSSADGGATWLPEIPVSPHFDSGLGWPPQQRKLGDYFTSVSDDAGVHVVYAATFGGEQDVFHVRIPVRDCDGNGIEDAAEGPEARGAGALRRNRPCPRE